MTAPPQMILTPLISTQSPYTYWVLELPKWSRVGGILITIQGTVKERNLSRNLAKEQGRGEGSQENVILYISHEDIVVCGIPFMYSFILFFLRCL